MTESLTLSLIKYTPYVKPQSRNSFVTIWGGKCEEGVFILQTFSSEGENANSIFIVINKLMRNVASKCLMSNAEHQVELHFIYGTSVLSKKRVGEDTLQKDQVDSRYSGVKT